MCRARSIASVTATAGERGRIGSVSRGEGIGCGDAGVTGEGWCMECSAPGVEYANGLEVSEN